MRLSLKKKEEVKKSKQNKDTGSGVIDPELRFGCSPSGCVRTVLLFFVCVI